MWKVLQSFQMGPKRPLCVTSEPWKPWVLPSLFMITSLTYTTGWWIWFNKNLSSYVKHVFVTFSFAKLAESIKASLKEKIIERCCCVCITFKRNVLTYKAFKSSAIHKNHKAVSLNCAWVILQRTMHNKRVVAITIANVNTHGSAATSMELHSQAQLC